MVLDLQHRRTLSQCGIAHPDPEQAVAVLHRVAANPCQGRNLRLRGRLDACAAAVEGQAVVAALDGVAFDATHGQRQLAVRAGVFQGHGRAVFAAVEHYVIVEQLHSLWAARDFA